MMCACVSHSAVLCWAMRYNIAVTDVADDGGPCMCECHDGCDDDDENMPATWGPIQNDAGQWNPDEEPLLE